MLSLRKAEYKTKLGSGFSFGVRLATFSGFRFGFFTVAV